MSSSNCCFLTCIQISQEAGKVDPYPMDLPYCDPMDNLTPLWPHEQPYPIVTPWTTYPIGTPWTAANQDLLSIEFSREEYWSCHDLFQGIFPTQGWNPSLLALQVDSLPLSHWVSPLLYPTYVWSQSIFQTPKSQMEETANSFHLCKWAAFR